ncbi:MAG: ATP-binding protein [Planctomycetaceae bacterium]|nr:ATP-binding protein [Planctomycetaceae bacterium]
MATATDPATSSSSTGKRNATRRATAETMATKQRDIAVSEFFAKNKHLLGFDNPRKALLTTVKEAVDNSLDACEEAGIPPEIWVSIDATQSGRFRVSVQDNGPGIVKKQIPLIFGKLLYGSKFHRLRMSRGQQGIGISAAGMNGMLTTGKPVLIVSKLSPKKPLHYFELQIDTKKNQPEIINGKGEGIDIEPGEKGLQFIKGNKIAWENEYPISEQHPVVEEVASGTRVTIELAAVYKRGKGSVDEYLEQTAIANPHVTIHYKDPEGLSRSYHRSTLELPAEAKEIKPHPYGVELGRLMTMLAEDKGATLSGFLCDSFSCVSPSVAKTICDTAKLSPRTKAIKVGQSEADRLYHAIQETRIRPPATDCIVPIGEQLLLKGLKHVVPGTFYAAETRPPGVYRGNPFIVEVALAYGGAPQSQKVTRDALDELLVQSDIRSLRKFLIDAFQGIGGESADRILKEAKIPPRCSPAKLTNDQRAALHEALHEVSISEGQAMTVMRFANRVPLQFQAGACAITQSIINMNWRSYGLTQSRGSLPNGPIAVMVHIASVWVPFTSESKEAVANYPEIEKELRLGLQAVGRKLSMYLRCKQQVAEEEERRSIFLRYLKEVAMSVSEIKGKDQQGLLERLQKVAIKRTSTADIKLDERGKKVEQTLEADDNVIIIAPPT